MIDCLTFEQLESYSLKKLQAAESREIYMHISSCELCACAVNGFASLPFSPAELFAINGEIDVKVSGKAAFPLTIAQLSLIVFSAISIGFVYMLPSLLCRRDRAFAVENKHMLKTKSHEQKDIMPVKIPGVPKTAPVRKMMTATSVQAVRTTTAIETLHPIWIGSLPAMRERDAEPIVYPNYGNDVIYIYDLKVADYSRLYFSAPEFNVFRTHIPASNENRSLAQPEAGPALKPLSADRILKEGLEAFSHQSYKQARKKFELLIENNPEDVNAIFYAALSDFHSGGFSASINGFNAIIESGNNVFVPESRWYLANAMLKCGRNTTAYDMFKNIGDGQGFYSAMAKEMLRQLSR